MFDAGSGRSASSEATRVGTSSQIGNGSLMETRSVPVRLKFPLSSRRLQISIDKQYDGDELFVEFL